MTALNDKLQALRERDLYRTRRVLDSAQGVQVVVDGERLLSFCSNDYLGLAADPRIIAALERGARDYGVGSGASHLVSGHMRPHHQLEEGLAAFVGAERALLFSTGYMANIGVMSALMDRHGVVLEDKLNHASLIDAAQLTRARLVRYRHADLAHLNEVGAALDGPMLVATDAVFSMDGDLAPLRALSEFSEKKGAWLLADDAHGLGVLGENGRGSLHHAGLRPTGRVIYMGTLGKGLGSFGAFVAGDEALIETLIQSARTYIYTTALPPAVAAATSEALRITEAEDWRREQLFARVKRFRAGAAALGLGLMDSETAIQPILFGSASKALAAAARLRELGIWVPAIRPPTVPDGAARLRVSLTAAHTESQVDQLLRALESVDQNESAS